MIKVATFSLLTIMLLTACGGPDASPTSSPGQSPGPSPGSSPSPSAPSSPSPTAAPVGAIGHPTGPAEIVLQYEVAGGFVPPEFFVTNAPQFTLYGDGTVVWRPREDIDQGGVPRGLPRFLQGRMDEDAIQALLAFALGQGRLAGAREHYMQNSCADCPSTIFAISADGMSKTVTIDALGFEERMDAVDRRGFQALAEWLNEFDAQARNGVAGDVTFYDPRLYLVVLTEAAPEMGEFAEWPWQDLSLAAFGPRGEGGWQRQAHLTREQVAVISEVPSGGTMGIWVEDPDGGLWSVALRPMLPDEVAAAQDR